MTRSDLARYRLLWTLCWALVLAATTGLAAAHLAGILMTPSRASIAVFAIACTTAVFELARSAVIYNADRVSAKQWPALDLAHLGRDQKPADEPANSSKHAYREPPVKTLQDERTSRPATRDAAPPKVLTARSATTSARSTTLLSSALLMAVALTAVVLNWFSILYWQTIIILAGGIASIVSVALLLNIARAQDSQLHGITELASDTKLATTRLAEAHVRNKAAAMFFDLDSIPPADPPLQYRCYRAVSLINGVDLPFTPVGENYCVQSIQGIFSTCGRPLYIVDVRATDKEPSPDRNIASHPNQIYMRSTQIPIRLIQPTKLPCWIRDGDIVARDRVIRAPDSSTSVGMLARLRHGKNRDGHLFLLEGTTQSGTWVVAHFLEQLLSANVDVLPPVLREALLQPAPSDLIAIIAGRFDTTSYEVRGKPHLLSLWVRNIDGSWEDLVLGDAWSSSNDIG